MSAAAVLDVARREIGTVENPPNSNRTKYGVDYGWNGVAWCAIFAWWVLTRAGDAPLIPKTASTVAMRDWYRARGQWFTSGPRPGDLVFFKFPGNNNPVNHVAIVEAVEPNGTLITIEGNTAGTAAGDQRNGGGVYRKRRAGSIVGFARPAYSPSAVLARPATGGGFLMALSDQEQSELLAIARNLNFQLFSGEGGPQTPGWHTWEGGTDETLTIVDYLRRNNVEVAALRATVDALAQAVARGSGGALTTEEIRAAVAEAIRDGLVEVDVTVRGAQPAAG